MSKGDPCVDCVERESSQEALDQGGEHSDSVRVSIPGGVFLRIEERIDTPRDVITGVRRRPSIRVEGFT